MTGRPTIAVDLRALVPEATGIGVYTRELLAALAARTGAPRYVGMAQTEPACAEEMRRLGIEIKTQFAPSGALWQQLRLPPRLLLEEVDLLFSPIFTLPRICPRPSVVTVADLTVYSHPALHTRKVRWSIQALLPSSLRQARRVIAISAVTAQDLEQRFPDTRDKTVVIHPGVTSNFNPASKEEVEAMRQEMGAPNGYLLYVGTLEPRKNLDRLLDAWEGLRRQETGFPPLLMAGAKGWHSAKLRRRIEELASLGLRHLGRIGDEKLVRLYQAASVFAYPSQYEGFGLPVAEAMACGVPVLTSNVSSLPEVASGAALTVDPESVEAIAEGLRRLVEDEGLAAEFSARGVERAAELSWERAAEATEEVFREVLRTIP